jgi:hypothetical protein
MNRALLVRSDRKNTACRIAAAGRGTVIAWRLTIPADDRQAPGYRSALCLLSRHFTAPLSICYP